MSSVGEDNEEPILLTGPNEETLHEFSNTLIHVAFPEITKRNRERRVISGQKLLKEKLDNSDGKCFLVMPCATRNLVYIEGNRCSMYQEIKHICSAEEGKNDVRV